MLKLDESLFESLPAEVGEEEQIKEFIERLSEVAVEELSLENVEEIQTTASQLAATAKELRTKLLKTDVKEDCADSLKECSDDICITCATPENQGEAPIATDIIYMYEVAPDENTCPDVYNNEDAAREFAITCNCNNITKVAYSMKDGTYIPTGYAETIEIVKPILEELSDQLTNEVKSSGGKDAWLKQANELAEELRNHIKYLETYASREINKGGAYDSEQEIQEVIEFEKQTLENMTKKIAQVEKAKI